MARLWALLLAFALGGCGRLGFEQVGGDGGGADGPAGADAAGADAAAASDAGATGCGPLVDDHMLALIPFDPDEGTMTLTDVAGDHDGTIEGLSPLWTDGPDGCGRAFRVPPAVGDESYALIPDSPDWDLDEGSIDFWFRFESPRHMTMVSRDADGTSLPGHLSLNIESDGSVLVRLQRPGDVYFCSEPLAEATWHHLGLNLGAPRGEMFINGELADVTGPHPVTGDECGGITTGGIAGNDNPWVIGASSARSAEGSAEPTESFFHGGAIDHVRISAARRDFTR